MDGLSSSPTLTAWPDGTRQHHQKKYSLQILIKFEKCVVSLFRNFSDSLVYIFIYKIIYLYILAYLLYQRNYNQPEPQCSRHTWVAYSLYKLEKKACLGKRSTVQLSKTSQVELNSSMRSLSSLLLKLLNLRKHIIYWNLLWGIIGNTRGRHKATSGTLTTHIDFLTGCLLLKYWTNQ